MGEHAASEPDRRAKLHAIIFGHETRSGRLFDELLLVAIVASVAAVVLESMETVRREVGGTLRILEWVFTVLFTAEYAVRIYCARRRVHYIFSFFGMVDLLAVLPSYVSVLLPGAQSLLVVRVLRLLRVFRVLKLVQFHGQANVLLRAVIGSLPKITVFLGTIMTIVVIMGASMYLIEGPEHGFHDIPEGMYWAIVTLTTVGFGDITPQTGPGRLVASAVMILGYAIIAVPTGIMSSEIVKAERATRGGTCRSCGAAGHAADATYCRRCGVNLDKAE